MSTVIRHIFICDHPECDTSVSLPAVAYPDEELRALGWVARKDFHLCPEHKDGGTS